MRTPASSMETAVKTSAKSENAAIRIADTVIYPGNLPTEQSDILQFEKRCKVWDSVFGRISQSPFIRNLISVQQKPVKSSGQLQKRLYSFATQDSSSISG